MTELIRNWLLGIICAAMVLALADHLVPNGSGKRICRMAGGLVLILAAVGPVLKLDEADIAGLAQFEVSTEDYKNELTRQQEILYESIIEQEAEAYISDKAKELGIDCGAEVTVAWKEGVPQMHSVILNGIWTDEQRAVLVETIESNLGISPSQQFYKEKEP